MFGYVKPHKIELRLREYNLYQAWYCGLCKTLRNVYGQVSGLVLNYDCAFLALLLSSINDEKHQCVPMFCCYKPARRKAPVIPSCAPLYYAADVNVLLYYYKLKDDWQDEKKLSALFGFLLLRGAVKKAGKRRPKTEQDIILGLNGLLKLEQECEKSIDVVADSFAHLLQNVALGYEIDDNKQKTALSWLAYNLGRFIYLADAWEDRIRDKEKGSYNPFVINDTSKEHASYLLYASLNEIEKAYDLLTIYNNRNLLDNIIYEGCRKVCQRILEGAKG